MSGIQNVVEYPDEGFAIVEDNAGKFLIFKETEEIVDLPEPEDPLKWIPPRPNVQRIFDSVY